MNLKKEKKNKLTNNCYTVWVDNATGQHVECILLISHDDSVASIVTSLKSVEKIILSRLMRKPTICICETKGADQLRNCEADQRIWFSYRDSTGIVQFLYFLNPKFPASSCFLCLCSLDCVRPVWKPHF